MSVNSDLNKYEFDKNLKKNPGINFCAAKKSSKTPDSKETPCENHSDIKISRIDKDTVEISSEKNKTKKKVKISDLLKSSYYNLTAKAIPNIMPAMQVCGEQLIPATALGAVVNALYGGLISITSIHNLLYNYSSKCHETFAETVKKECKKEFSPKNFEIAQKRGLFKPDYRKDADFQFGKDDISALTKLNDEQFEKIKELFYIPERGLGQLKGETLAGLSKLPDEVYENIKKLIFSNTNGFPNFTGHMILDFAGKYELIQKAKKLDPYIGKQIDKIYAEDEPNLNDITVLAGAVNEIKMNSSAITSPYLYAIHPILYYFKTVKPVLSEEDKKELELERKFYCAKEFVKHNPKSPISKYFYENYYLKELETLKVDKDVIKKIKEFYDKYKVQIYVNVKDLNLKYSSDSFDSVLEEIEKEFSKWIKASKGKTKLPPVIDFGEYKYQYTREYSKYGPVQAFCEFDTGSLNFREQSKWRISRNIRHELVHTNDTKKGYDIDKKYNLKEIIPEGYAHRGKYFDELSKAGIPYEYIVYANQNTKEYVAVAAEGDTSKYSDEFKKVLVGLGLPEWVFDLDK